MRFIYAFQLVLLLGFSSIPLIENQIIFAQNDDFDIESEDWPDFSADESEDESFSKPVESKPVESKATPKPVQSNVAEPVKTQVEPSVAPVESKPPVPVQQPSYSSSPVSEPVKTTPKPVYQPVVSSTIKRSGPPLLMIARPTYAPYSSEQKTMYISAISEAYFHFKLGAITQIQVIAQERMANNIQYYRDFSRRISRASYIEAAKKLGATYLIYHEYEPQGKKIKYDLELYSISDNQKLYTGKKEIDLSQFEAGLLECVNDIASTIVQSIPASTNKVLAEDILGNNSKAIEALGSQIVAEGDYSKNKAEAVVSSYEKICNQNSNMHLATFVAANAFARAGQYEKAVNYQRKLISTFGNGYPGLYLKIANYYKMQKNYNDALDAAEEAKRHPDLDLPASAAIAGIYEAKDDLNRAQNEYLAILKKGGEDANIYFELALVSIGLRNIAQANNYLSKAASAGRELDRSDYYELGLRYAELGANDEAIEAFKNSLGIQQDNIDAWLQLAQLYEKMNRQTDAAECYISLFHMNNSANKDYLVKAGLIYESLDMPDRAKDVYDLFLARQFKDPEVSVRLAKIEVANQNCKRAVELVNGIDTNSTHGYDVKKIYESCKHERRVVVVTKDDPAQKGWAAVFAWRLSSSLLTIAGAGVGYYFNTQVEDCTSKYNSAQNQIETIRYRDDRDTYKTVRNLCYAGGAVGLTSLTASIALPIIFRK
jgi:tetratricopeptide (TPR) repeat protein